jgi:cytidylate kinase
MSIVTISRGSYSRGKEVAEKVAERLGYESVSREILLEASEHFNIPEIKLTAAISQAPSFLDKFTFGKKRYLAFIEAAFLEHVSRDNIVYHGFAGHFFLKDVPNALLVRVIADKDDRARLVMERDRYSYEEALKFIDAIDRERRQWSLHLYGKDSADPALYDLLVHIGKLTSDDAVELICRPIEQGRFPTTDESRRRIDDLLMAARCKSRLRNDNYPGAEVECKNGVIIVTVAGSLSQEASLAEGIRNQLSDMAGVREVRVKLDYPEL